MLTDSHSRLVPGVGSALRSAPREASQRAEVRVRQDPALLVGLTAPTSLPVRQRRVVGGETRVAQAVEERRSGTPPKSAAESAELDVALVRTAARGPAWSSEERRRRA
jgi:hypothetical protein